jgi:hypothetical protein
MPRSSALNGYELSGRAADRQRGAAEGEPFRRAAALVVAAVAAAASAAAVVAAGAASAAAAAVGTVVAVAAEIATRPCRALRSTAVGPLPGQSAKGPLLFDARQVPAMNEFSIDYRQSSSTSTSRNL